MVFMDQDTFTAAFFWAWAHGPAGATATVGASTGSLTAAEGAIAAVVEWRPTAAALPAAEQFAAVAKSATMAAQSEQAAMRDPAQVTQQSRVPAHRTPAHNGQRRVQRRRRVQQQHRVAAAAGRVDMIAAKQNTSN
jgi:hypothetical protein